MSCEKEEEGVWVLYRFKQVFCHVKVDIMQEREKHLSDESATWKRAQMGPGRVVVS